MHRPPPWYCLLVPLVVSLLGCAGHLKELTPYTGAAGEPFASRPEGAGAVEVTYLGVGGYIVRRGPDALLFAPSFTNPGVLDLLLDDVESDETRVGACMRGLPVDDVEWILVGHSHYDHLLDVPAIAGRLAPGARVLGSRTTSHILAARLSPERRVTLDGCVASEGRQGRWLYNSRRTLRVLAIESEHGPHFLGHKLLSEARYDKDLEELPRSARDGWREGETYAYVVDFLRPDGSIEFRIHYQDAASTPPLGFIPREVRSEYPEVDLAITCVGGSRAVRRYPDLSLRNTRPRHVILGHWEDFFGNRCEEEPKVVRLANLQAFIRRVEEHAPRARWLLPRPLSRMYLPIRAPASSRAPGASLDPPAECRPSSGQP